MGRGEHLELRRCPAFDREVAPRCVEYEALEM